MASSRSSCSCCVSRAKRSFSSRSLSRFAHSIMSSSVGYCSPHNHTHTHTHTHTETHTHIHTHTHTYIHRDTHTHTETHRNTYTQTDTCTRTRTYEYTNTHTYTHRNTYTQTDTHICTSQSVSSHISLTAKSTPQSLVFCFVIQTIMNKHICSIINSAHN